MRLNFRLVCTDALAGCLTAAVFYAEYTGLGAALGVALPGRGAAALGSVMAIGAVVVSCFLALLLRQPLIAGPRAASLAVLIVGMKFAVENSSSVEGRSVVAMAALATMLVVAAGTQLLGLIPRVQAWIYQSHVALRKGFIFATAIGIVVGLSATLLDGCLRVSPGLSAAIVLTSVASAMAWSQWCRASSAKRAWQTKLVPLAMVIGVSLATAAYYLLVMESAREGLCGTLGSVGLHAAQLTQLWVTPSSFYAAGQYLPAWVWAALAVLGILLGAVLLLESLTALRDSKDKTGAQFWSSQLKLRALANLLCAPLGLASSSLSASRTNALIETYGRTRMAVFFHGLALVAILFLLNQWIAKVPHLAVAVALLLVAIQMIDDETRTTVWSEGYQPKAAKSSVFTTWIFWGILGLSVVAGSTLRYFGWGFGGGPLIALLVGGILTSVFLPSNSRSAHA